MQARLTPTCTLEYDDDGRGTPVLLLHAFPLARAMWRPQFDGLQGDCRLLAPDLRGFGGSGEFETAPSVEGMAEDAAALLDLLGLRQPVVVGGLSMGGYVALAFARKYPQRLRGLILADTRAEADSAEARANRDKTIAFAESHTAADVIEQMLPKLLSEQTRRERPEVVEEVRRIASAQTVHGIVQALRALRDRPDASGSLGAIQVPVLVIVGADDQLTPPALAEKLVAGIPHARLALIPGAGHLSNLERPREFNDAVAILLRSLV